MTLFVTEADLASCLRSLDVQYDVQYEQWAGKLWAGGLNTVSMLADASVDHLCALGIDPFHAKDINTQAGHLQSRIKAASNWAADILTAEGTDAATVVEDNILVTFAHPPHASWQLGDMKEVRVHNPADACRRIVKAKVFLKTEGPDGPDIIALEVDPASSGGIPVEGARPDFGLYTGQPYFLLGRSTQGQRDLTSAAHGRIASTDPEAYRNIRGDLLSATADNDYCPGGGVFDATTCRLLGVCVGTDDRGRQTVVLPTAYILPLLDHARAIGGVHCIMPE